MIYFLIFLTAFFAGIWLFTNQPKFGKPPAGERLERIKKSKQYKNGKFENSSYTPDLTEGANFFTVLIQFFFERNKQREPKAKIPTQKTDLLHLDPKQDVLVWFGHSSYFIQLDGKTFLIDPVFSGSVSPVSMIGGAFAGADVYKPADFPSIDYLLISHDHWDHLDYETVLELKPKVKQVICGLGTGSHLEHWGYDANKIIERDWHELVDLGNGFSITLTPARHFSGRSFKRNQVLWVSFVLKTPSMKLYLGADSGYDTHFKEIGEQYGPFDLALLECGQYSKNWKYIHMMPEETIQAAIDLKTEKAMAVHWGKFALANHAWDDSINRASTAAKEKHVNLITPMIGEAVLLKSEQSFGEWWKSVKY